MAAGRRREEHRATSQGGCGANSHAETSGRAGDVDSTAPQHVRHATHTSMSVEQTTNHTHSHNTSKTHRSCDIISCSAALQTFVLGEGLQS